MHSSRVQARGQITLPKELREQACIEPGDIVSFRVVRPGTIEITAVRVKPLEFFWERFAVDTPYDEKAIREDAEAEAARWVINE